MINVGMINAVGALRDGPFPACPNLRLFLVVKVASSSRESAKHTAHAALLTSHFSRRLQPTLYPTCTSAAFSPPQFFGYLGSSTNITMNNLPLSSMPNPFMAVPTLLAKVPQLQREAAVIEPEKVDPRSARNLLRKVFKRAWEPLPGAQKLQNE
jgi:hypothetical protein